MGKITKTRTFILVILAKKRYHKYEGSGLAFYLLKESLAQNLTDCGVPQKIFVLVVPFFSRYYLNEGLGLTYDRIKLSKFLTAKKNIYIFKIVSQKNLWSRSHSTFLVKKDGKKRYCRNGGLGLAWDCIKLS